MKSGWGREAFQTVARLHLCKFCSNKWVVWLSLKEHVGQLKVTYMLWLAFWLISRATGSQLKCSLLKNEVGCLRFPQDPLFWGFGMVVGPLEDLSDSIFRFSSGTRHKTVTPAIHSPVCSVFRSDAWRQLCVCRLVPLALFSRAEVSLDRTLWFSK